MEEMELVLNYIFGAKPLPCRSLLAALEMDLVPKKHIATAHAILNSYPYPRKPKSTLPDHSWRYNSDPSWDNVIKAFEEDR